MDYRPLGRTGLKVSALCLGTMTWGKQNTEAEAHEQMDAALAAGVNFWDTAELYPVTPEAATQGRTEEYIGRRSQVGWRRRTRHKTNARSFRCARFCFSGSDDQAISIE